MPHVDAALAGDFVLDLIVPQAGIRVGQELRDGGGDLRIQGQAKEWRVHDTFRRVSIDIGGAVVPVAIPTIILGNP
jgi:hypothetical protein